MHPSPDALVELHFGEATPAERAAAEEHVRSCAECAAFFQDLRRLERELHPGPGDEPPADGLERVLRRVAEARPRPRRRSEWAAAVFPSLAAMLGGAWAIRAFGARLSALGLLAGAPPGPVPAELVGLSLAALGLLTLGVLATLAVAPILILESHGRS